MNIVIGSDHSGFQLKEKLKKHLQKQRHNVSDFGCYSEESVDWPDIALLVAEAMRDKKFDRGILVDGTGGAMPVAANKVPGVRAVCVYNELTARFASEHDDANIICLGGRMIGDLEAQEIVDVFLKTQFAGERHLRRLKKVEDIERKYSK
ncbi:MAG: ribose 5-phosphate isomerase B [Elusimicrobiota bacterium]